MPLLFNGTHLFSTGFFFKDFQVKDVDVGFGAFYDGGVGGNVVGVLLGLERRLEDRIGVAVVGNRNVLIVAER